MGNVESGFLHRKISKQLPPVRPTSDKAEDDQAQAHFTSEKEKEEFISALITLMTFNRDMDIDDHEIKLLYSKSGDKGAKLNARLVAMKDGAIKAKIDAPSDGATEAEAFRALVTHVGEKFTEILADVPSLVKSESDGKGGQGDAPPAYS